ncbi:unnamed protein product [Arctia plantaginis]|uniref:Uncharacterized protein n=1 Tax=Arctia plantaginis TaxID=874455 RepID=A0A8S1A5Z4_ARCPL|nr:unnamed protein product [Arctia plantaginis]
MMTPIEEKKDEKIRTGMVQVSDGKSRPRPARLVLTMDAVTVQREAPVPVQPTKEKNVPHARQVVLASSSWFPGDAIVVMQATKNHLSAYLSGARL